MKIAITLVHNKTDAENEAQIQTVLNLIETIQTQISWQEPVLDETGNPTGTTQTQTTSIPHYQFKNVEQKHKVIFFQTIPFGITKPISYNKLLGAEGCGGVMYGEADAQVGIGRFFNWGMKRGIDRGADISIFLTDPTDLTALKLKAALLDLKENSGLLEKLWGRIVTKKALIRIGQLKEDRTLLQAITDYKSRLTAGGLE